MSHLKTPEFVDLHKQVSEHKRGKEIASPLSILQLYASPALLLTNLQRHCFPAVHIANHTHKSLTRRKEQDPLAAVATDVIQSNLDI